MNGGSKGDFVFWYRAFFYKKKSKRMMDFPWYVQWFNKKFFNIVFFLSGVFFFLNGFFRFFFFLGDRDGTWKICRKKSSSKNSMAKFILQMSFLC